jgi:hypothetical protein
MSENEELPSERETVDILSGRIRKLEGSAPTLASKDRDKIISEREKEAGFLRKILKNIGRGHTQEK